MRIVFVVQFVPHPVTGAYYEPLVFFLLLSDNIDAHMRRALICLLNIANILGLTYLLDLAWYSRIASDDYSYEVVLHRDGFFGGLKYWYFNLQGRFSAHAVIQAVLQLLYDHNINLVFYHAFVIALGTYGLFSLFKNVARLKQIPFDSYLMLNVACFVFILSIYNNFQMNTFYWLTNSPMYVGGVVVFLIGVAAILSKKKAWISYLSVAVCHEDKGTENLIATLRELQL